MLPLTRNTLERLAGSKAWPSVSIYLPTLRQASEVSQDRLRLKNLANEALELLERNDIRGPEARRMIEPVFELGQESSFWRRRGEGLALFVTRDEMRHERLPIPVEEIAQVGSRFHLKPLLPLLSSDGFFYILAISKNQVRLLLGTRFTVAEVEADSVPGGLAEVLRFDQFEKQLQYHVTAAPAARGGSAPVYHGHAVGVDDEEDHLRRYFQAIDQGLHTLLREARTPLVLAGVENYFSKFREIFSYEFITDEGVPGSPDKLRPEQLHQAAWKIVEPLFDGRRDRDAERFRQALTDNLGSADPRKVVQAAAMGRIDTLFVPRDAQLWGEYDEVADTVALHEDRQPRSQDLLDLAAVQTLLKKGTVHAVPSGQMPGEHELAAVFRY